MSIHSLPDEVLREVINSPSHRDVSSLSLHLAAYIACVRCQLSANTAE